jgi:hypothetical protein
VKTELYFYEQQTIYNLYFKQLKLMAKVRRSASLKITLKKLSEGVRDITPAERTK